MGRFPQQSSLSVAGVRATWDPKAATSIGFGSLDPPPYWLNRGLLWPFPIPYLGRPIGATDYNSLTAGQVSGQFGDGGIMSPDHYAGAAVSPNDFPVAYFNNGEGYGGVATVYARPQVVPLAWTLLANLFFSARLEVISPAAVFPAVPLPELSRLAVQSSQGVVVVSIGYVLLAPVPFTTVDFWPRHRYFFLNHPPGTFGRRVDGQRGLQHRPGI